MNSKIYRCGYCGTPTDPRGHTIPFESETFRKVTRIIDTYGDGHTELVHGYCCREREEDRYVRVTREMAMDAQDPGLEGERCYW